MRRFALHTLLALAASGIAGCWPLFTVAPRSPGAPQVATAEIPPSTSSTQVSQPPERHKNSSPKHTNKSAHAATADRSGSDAAGNSAPDAAPEVPPPSLTLAGESGSRTQAQQLVDRADRGLAKIDRSKLRGTDVTTYDQASGFVLSAQRALGENDYFAASGLAKKASTLTARLSH